VQEPCGLRVRRMDGGNLREIVSMAAREVFGKDFSHEQDVAVRALLRGVPTQGGSASRDSLEQLVRTAFEAGLAAATLTQQNLMPTPSGPMFDTVARLQKEPFSTVSLDKL